MNAGRSAERYHQHVSCVQVTFPRTSRLAERGRTTGNRLEEYTGQPDSLDSFTEVAQPFLPL